MIDPKEALGLVRYLGPARIEIEGNRQAGMAYIQMGRSVMGALVNDMTLGKYEVGCLQKTFPDGTTIIALRHYGQHTIRILTPELLEEEIVEQFELFLESGYVDLRPLYINGIEGPKYPGKLHYTALLEEAYATTGPDRIAPVLFGRPTDSPWLDWLYLSYENSAFSDASSLVNPYAPGRDSEAIPANALGKRAVYHYAQPTAATGKLKLYLQCLLGQRGDKLVNTQTTQMLAMPGTYYGTWGLYSAPSGAYFLVNLYSDRVWFYPLSTSRLGRSLQALLESQAPADDFASRLKIEAYVLAETRFQPPGESNLTGAIENGFVRYFISDDAIPSDATIETLAYGWKGSWDGSEWSIVVRQPIPDGPGYKWQWMRRYKLRIEEVIDTETNVRLLNPYLSLEEEGAWTPRVATDIVWTPLRIPVGPEDMTWVQWQPSASIPVTLLDGDVPVYCWYDSQDNLIVVRYNLQSSVNYGFNSSAVTLVNSLYTCNGSGAAAQYVWTLNEKTKGFYVDKIDRGKQESVFLFRNEFEEMEFISTEFDDKKQYESAIEITNTWISDWECVSYFGGFTINGYCGTDDSYVPGFPAISQEVFGDPDPCIYDIYSQTRYTQTTYSAFDTFVSSKLNWAWEAWSVLALPMFCSEAAYIGTRGRYAYDQAKLTFVYSSGVGVHATTHDGNIGYTRLCVDNVYHGHVYNQSVADNATYRQSTCKIALFTKYDSNLLYEQDEMGTAFVSPEVFPHIWEISYSNPLLGNRIGVYCGVTGDYYYNGDDRPYAADWELCTSDKLPIPSDMQGLTIGWF